jgi:hypothetical protein
VLWIGYAFASGIAARLRLMGIACAIVIAVLAVNLALQHIYGSEGVDTGGNFAWTTCGLSIGKTWNGCDALYQKTLSSLPNERAQSLFLFAQTWRNFIAHPGVLLAAVAGNFVTFLRGVGPFMLASQIQLFSTATGDPFLVLLPFLAGIFYVWRNASTVERSFWIAMLASLPISAGIVMMADGWRLLHVTHLFVAAFLALGFAAPQAGNGKRPAPALKWQPGAAVLATSLLVFLVFPALAHAMALRELRAHPPIPPPGSHEEIVTGGPRMSGFLVISDEAPRPNAVPALHVSEFVYLIRSTHLQDDFGPFLNQVLPRVPFAFVGAGRMDGPNNTNIYIAPPEVLTRRNAWAWRFTTRTWTPGETPWSTLQDVVAAEPLP